MSREVIHTERAARPPATYSLAIKAAGLVFVSGTTPLDPESGAIKGQTIQESSPPARQAAKLPARIAGLRVSIACIAEA